MKKVLKLTSLCAVAFVVASCGAQQLKSNLKSSDRLYVSCLGDLNALHFYGPDRGDISNINFVQVDRIIGGDAASMVTSMACSKNPNRGRSEIQIGCFDTKQLDGGIYSVALTTTASGRTHAILERVSSRGAKVLGKLNCTVE